MAAIYRVDELVFSIVVVCAFLGVVVVATLVLLGQLRQALEEERCDAG